MDSNTKICQTLFEKEETKEVWRLELIAMRTLPLWRTSACVIISVSLNIWQCIKPSSELRTLGVKSGFEQNNNIIRAKYRKDIYIIYIFL